MADFNQINQFGSGKPARSGEGMTCVECEAMLTDFIDGTLSAKDLAAFDLHIATCKECSHMLADAQRGAALLEMLKSPRPEPSAFLLDRIIAQTSGAPAQAAANVLGLSVIDNAVGSTQVLAPASFAGTVALPAAAAGNVLPFRPRNVAGLKVQFNLQAMTRTMMQPRFAMTAAMAFFSIALTMNLTGVHISELKASDLKPSSIRHTFYQADASLVRYYDNLRVVYELESRVNDLKQANAGDDQPASGKAGSNAGSGGDATPGSGDGKSGQDGKQKHTQPKAGSGTSQRRNPLSQEFRVAEEEHFGRRANRDSSVAVFNRVDRPGTQNSLKEKLQEGELV